MPDRTPNSPAPVPVLINAAAGGGRRGVSGRVAEALASAGCAARVREVPGDAISAAVGQAKADGAKVIGVAGGDGTLLSAAEALAGGDAALAPLPTGTLNHFARRLGLGDLHAAAAALGRATIEPLPLGIIDDRVFLNTATFGAYADVVRLRERLRGGLSKWPAAAVAFVAVVARLRMVEVTLVVEGRRLERRTALVWVGVGWGSFPLVHESPDSRPAPELEIVVLRSSGVAESASLLLRILLSLKRRERPIRHPALEVLHARELLIEGSHRIGVTLDGEVLRCEPPILVAVQPEGLRVVTGRRGRGDTPAADAARAEARDQP